jgi:hypothetical protein
VPCSSHRVDASALSAERVGYCMQPKPLVLVSVFTAGLLAAGVLGLSPRTPGSVDFGIVHCANGYAYFSITNSHTFSMQYGVAIERKCDTGWPDYYGANSYSATPLRHEPPDGNTEMPVLAPFGAPQSSPILRITWHAEA